MILYLQQKMPIKVSVVTSGIFGHQDLQLYAKYASSPSSESKTKSSRHFTQHSYSTSPSWCSQNAQSSSFTFASFPTNLSNASLNIALDLSFSTLLSIFCFSSFNVCPFLLSGRSNQLDASISKQPSSRVPRLPSLRISLSCVCLFGNYKSWH